MATIQLEQEVRVEIGIAPSEMGREQILTVYLCVEVVDECSDNAARTGRISETLDYSELRHIVSDAFAERRYNLLEEVTTLIRDEVLAMSRVCGARVSVTKHRPWPDVPRLTLTR